MGRTIRYTTVERLEAVAIAGIVGGYAKVETWSVRDKRFGGHARRRVTLEISGTCEYPYGFEMHARDSAWHGRAVRPLTVVVNTMCRKCGNCRQRRSAMWQAKAVDEWSKSPLTIFGTLTTTPEYDMEVDALARVSLFEKGVDFDRDLTVEEQFRARVRYAGLELTKFLKRIREGDKNRGRPEIRYLCVAEAHNGARTSERKRFRPHWHVLLHETSPVSRLVLPDEWARNAAGELRSDRYGNPFLTETSFLKTQWKVGFSTFAMCRSPQAAAYLCKYLTKDETSVRIRASFGYGGSREKDGRKAPTGVSEETPEVIRSPPPTGGSKRVNGVEK